MNHLSILNKKTFDEDYIALMLKGEKKLGIKFSARKTAPYQKLRTGDIIYLKDSSGPIRGRVRVANVHNEEFVDPSQIMEFLTIHAAELGITNDAQLKRIWQKNSSTNYLCWWHIEQPEACEPVDIQKNDRRAWVADYDVPEHVLASF
jgi:hypothetical protein